MTAAPFDPLVSVFPCATDAETVSDLPLSAIIDRIRSPELAGATERITAAYVAAGGGKAGKMAIDAPKKRLPAVTLAGAFYRRANAAWRDPSGLVQIDIDNLSAAELVETCAMLTACPWVACLWSSPSGRGLKGAVRVPVLTVPDPIHYTEAWRAVTRWLASIGLVNDPAAKDCARLAYLANDPNAWLNPSPEVFDLGKWVEPVPVLTPPHTEPHAVPDAERRALAYVRAMPVSVGGSHGSAPMVAAVRTLRDGFDLNGAILWRCLEAWNVERASPPWSRAELEHALASVEKVPPTRGRGWLLNSDEPDEPEFDLRTFAETERKAIDWLWDGVLVRGMCSLLAGIGGLGKSFVICDLAARISAGKPLPDGVTGPPQKVLLLTREDDPGSVLLPRLEAAGADLTMITWSRFHGKTGDPLDLALHVKKLSRAVARESFALIVIDTFAAFAPEGTDANSSGDVRLLLNALARMASETGACVLVIAHTRKGGAGEGPAQDAVAGSAQMVAGVRTVLALENGKEEGERWVRIVKTNLPPPKNSLGWTWRFGPSADPETPIIQWADAGALYGSLDVDRKDRRCTLDPQSVLAAMGPLLNKRPLTLTALADKIWAELRKTPANRKLTQKSVAMVLDDITAESMEFYEVGHGHRGAVIIGKRGTLPESPREKAERIATYGMSVRELAEKAGVSKDLASSVLVSFSREKHAEKSLPGHQDIGEGVSVLVLPRVPLGARGSTRTGQHPRGIETDTVGPGKGTESHEST